MTPGARLAAAAEVLDRIAGGSAAADEVLRAWGRANRYAGSGDRRAIADRVYGVLRARQQLAWAAGPEDGRGLVLASLALIDAEPLERIEALYSGGGYAPAALTPEERERLERFREGPGDQPTGGLPAFIADDLKATYGDDWIAEAEALLRTRAPVDLRVNGLKATLEQARESLAAEGLPAEPTPWSPWGLRLPAEPAPDVQATAAFRKGWIEVQDEGSQVAALLAGAHAGETVVDYCAGGGGKTLALAQQMHGRGRLVACDVVQRRLDAIRPRLARASAQAELRLLGPDGEGVEDLEGCADLVLVDAPCSGSGTWRRHPEAAGRLTAEEVERLHALQLTVLERAATLVKPGGRLVYVTCSVLRRENEDVIAAFETAHADFRPGALGPPAEGGDHALRLSPHATSTDGFFVAAYERRA